jgi:predicted nucleic acid-binding protein
VQLLAHLDQARGRFRGNPFRVVRLQGEELELAEELQERHWLSIDTGEADVLALCIQRGPGWIAVLDDRPAHDLALMLGIPTMGTIEVLLEAIRQNLLSLNQGEYLLDEMKASWPRAPRGKLQMVSNATL